VLVAATCFEVPTVIAMSLASMLLILLLLLMRDLQHS